MTAAPHFAIERASLNVAGGGPSRGIGWQAKFYGGNGELVWLTEVYRHRDDALNAIGLLKSEAILAPIELDTADAV